MKKIFALVLFLVLGKFSYSQYPLQQNLGNDSTIVVSKGATQSRFVNVTYTDTASANLQRIRQYPASLIATTSGGLRFWIRNSSATGWIEISTTSSTVGVTSVATNNATGITGGTITSTGTLAIDTLLISTRAWRQKGIDSVASLITGSVSGTTNYVSKFTATNSLGNSQIFDNGTSVGFATATPDSLLTVELGTHLKRGVRLSGLPQAPGTKSLRIDANGTLSIADTTSGGGVGTVTSVATNNGTGITGGTITTAGTLAIDTLLISTRAWRQKGIDSLQANINGKLNISDTASMLSPYINNVGYGLGKTSQSVYADSATLSAYYLRRKDSLTTTNPLGYVTKKILADTASALRSAIGSGYVPYTGATQNVDLGQFGLKTKYVEFDTSSQAVTDRRLQWSNDDGTLQFGMTNGSTITQRIGLEQFARVKNVDNVQINKGQVVYLYGASGDRASVKLANSKHDSTSSKTLGVATENIPVNSVGLVGTFGTVGKLNNLATFSPGDIVYLDSVSGQLTNVKPVAPYNTVFIGVVERNNSGNGLLFTNVQNGYELEELHNVLITSPVRNNAILVYDSTRRLWIDTTIAQAGLAVTQVNTNSATGITGGPINTTGTISADTLLLSTRAWRQKGIDSVAALINSNVSGTTNYVPKFTGANTIGNSNIFDDGTNVGLFTASPLEKLDVRGRFLSVGTTTTTESAMFVQSQWGGGPNKFVTKLAANSQGNVVLSSGYNIASATAPSSATVTEILRADYLGNVGIGGIAPDSMLTVNLGTHLKRGVRMSGLPTGVGTKALRIDANGRLSIADTTTAGVGTVTSVATNNGTGITGGTITASGTLAIDTLLISTRAWRQKGIDSVAALPRVTSVATNTGTGITGGTITTSGTIAADTLLLSTRAWRQKGIDSVAALPRVTSVGSGYGLSGGTITTSGTLLVDSATLSNYYLRRKDSLTTTNLLGYVTRKILADTASAIRSAATGGTVTSVATNNGTGITGGTIVSTGTLAIDTLLISTRLWRQKGIDSVISVMGSRVSGTTNYVSKFTGTNTVGNSQLFDDGTNVGIATTSPLEKLDVRSPYSSFGISSAAESAIFIQSNWDASNKYVGKISSDALGNIAISTGTVANATAPSSGTYTQRLRINSSGNLSLGNIAPDSMLTVNLGTHLKRGVRLSGLPTGVGTKALRIDANGTLSIADTTAGGSGTVTSVATNTGTGITGGTITTSGTIAADTLLLSTRAWRQKGIDSVAALANTKISGSGTTNYIPKFTSSSAIGNSQVFDNGTNVIVGGTSGLFKFQVNDASLATLGLNATGEATDQKNWAFQYGTSVGAGTFRLRAINDAGTDGQNAYIITRSGTAVQTHQWLTAGSERMRISSTGNVSIGNTNNTYKLDVTGTGLTARIQGGTSSNPNLTIQSAIYPILDFVSDDANANNRNWRIASVFNDYGMFEILSSTAAGGTASTSRLAITRTGNLGLGVTPSAASFPSIESSVGIFTGVSESNIGANNYFNTAWKYITSSVAASRYRQGAGVHEWYTAPAGTAGNNISFTQAMTLDASGNLGLGTTTIGSKLQVNGGAAIGYSASTAAPTNGLVVAGNVGIGTASPNSYAGYGALTLNGATNGGIIDFTTGGTLIGEILNVSTDFIVSAFANVPLSFRTNNVERGRFLAGGGLIIGNGETAASPSTGIISGTGGTGTNVAGAEFRIRGGASTGSGAGGPITFYTSAAGTAGTTTNNAVERMRITSGGLVGIGTNSPADMVTVGTTTTGGNVRVVSSSYGTNGIFRAYGTDGNEKLQMGGIGNTQAYIYTPASIDLLLYTGGTERARLTSAGNLGIGTTAPEALLHVFGSTSSLLIVGGTGATAKQTIIGHVSTGNGYTSIQSVFQGTAFTPIALNPSGGNVGIGTTAPTDILNLSYSNNNGGNVGLYVKNTNTGTAANYAGLYAEAQNGTVGFRAHATTTTALGGYGVTGTSTAHPLLFVTSDAERMRITSGGLVGIGTSSPSGRLHIDPADNEVGLNISTSSLTSANAQSLIDLTQTWNTTGNPTAIKLNVTNTASGTSSKLMDLQVGGTSQFQVTKGGAIQTVGGVPWKLTGSVVTLGGSNLQGISVDVNGTTYYLVTGYLPEPEPDPAALPASGPSANYKTYNKPTPVKSAQDAKIQTLEREVAELKEMVKKLANK